MIYTFMFDRRQERDDTHMMYMNLYIVLWPRFGENYKKHGPFHDGIILIIIIGGNKLAREFDKM